MCGSFNWESTTWSATASLLQSCSSLIPSLLVRKKDRTFTYFEYFAVDLTLFILCILQDRGTVVKFHSMGFRMVPQNCYNSSEWDGFSSLRTDLGDATIFRNAWKRLVLFTESPFNAKHRASNMENYIRYPKLHPGRLTWNIVWKITFLSKWVVCMFHVNLPGCSR